MLKVNGEMIYDHSPVAKTLERMDIRKVEIHSTYISMEGFNEKGERAFADLQFSTASNCSELSENDDLFKVQRFGNLLSEFIKQEGLVNVKAHRDYGERVTLGDLEVGHIGITVFHESTKEQMQLAVYSDDFLFSTNVIKGEAPPQAAQIMKKISSDFQARD